MKHEFNYHHVPPTHRNTTPNESESSKPSPPRPSDHIRLAYLELIKVLEPNYFITFNFGYKIQPLNGLDRIDKFCRRLEKAALGRYWFKRHQSGRLYLIGFPEHLDINPHWHAVARLPDTMVTSIEKHGQSLWSELAPRGQLDVEEIESEIRVASYIMKQFRRSSAEHVAVYSPHDRKK